MKASTERVLIRWIHILFSIPIVGYIYGPVAESPWRSGRTAGVPARNCHFRIVALERAMAQKATSLITVPAWPLNFACLPGLIPTEGFLPD